MGRVTQETLLHVPPEAPLALAVVHAHGDVGRHCLHGEGLARRPDDSPPEEVVQPVGMAKVVVEPELLRQAPVRPATLPKLCFGITVPTGEQRRLTRGTSEQGAATSGGAQRCRAQESDFLARHAHVSDEVVVGRGAHGGGDGLGAAVQAEGSGQRAVLGQARVEADEAGAHLQSGEHGPRAVITERCRHALLRQQYGGVATRRPCGKRPLGEVVQAVGQAEVNQGGKDGLGSQVASGSVTTIDDGEQGGLTLGLPGEGIGPRVGGCEHGAPPAIGAMGRGECRVWGLGRQGRPTPRIAYPSYAIVPTGWAPIHKLEPTHQRGSTVSGPGRSASVPAAGGR